MENTSKRSEKITMKSILFNTEMVSAILDGKKAVTRQLIKNEKIGGILHNLARIKNTEIPDEEMICTSFCRDVCVLPSIFSRASERIMQELQVKEKKWR